MLCNPFSGCSGFSLLEKDKKINLENEKQQLSVLKPKLDHFNIFGILSELGGVAGLAM